MFEAWKRKRKRKRKGKRKSTGLGEAQPAVKHETVGWDYARI